MKKYEYEHVVLKNNYVANAVITAHREIIDAYAQKDYRYAGYIPTKYGPSGKTVELDLIFETEE